MTTNLTLILNAIILIAALVAIIYSIKEQRRKRNYVSDEDYNALQSKYDTQTQELNSCSGELIRVGQQLDNESQRSIQLQNMLETKDAQTKEFQDNILELSNLNSTLQTQLDAANLKIEELHSLVQNRGSQIDDFQQKVLQLTAEKVTLETQLKSFKIRVDELLKQIEELKGSEEELEKRLKDQFEIISNKIIEESRTKVNEFNATRITELMKPFEKDLREFKEQINSSTKEQSKERTQLELQIQQMVKLSEGMSQEAKNLSTALRGNNKTAGNWGEAILENILQNSGLIAGKEGYELQSMLRDEQGNAYVNEGGRKMIPDAIVHFPDSRNVIIDSKVSIAAYTDYCNAEDAEDKKAHLKRHIASIKAHIDELNVKSYERYVAGSLDFVMMFIPNDFAAMLALQEDLNLWQNAYNKKILIISPTNLITSLKIVSDLWSREKQQQNVEKILERGRLLYDKCCTFADSFKKVGDGMQSVMKLYNSATNQLGVESGVIRQAEMLVELGIKSKKSLVLKSSQSTVTEEIHQDISQDGYNL